MRHRSPILAAWISRRQAYFSIFCILAIVSGSLGILRRIFVGFDGLVWLSLASMLAFAAAARRFATSRNITDDVVFRLINAPEWRALSQSQRNVMKLLDLPLYLAVRERESRRMFDEELTRLLLTQDGFRLFPIEAEHTAPYFLKAISQAVAIYGITVRRVEVGGSDAKYAEPFVELSWLNAAVEVRDYLRSELNDGATISLSRLRDMILSGFLPTVPADQRHWYFK